MKNSVLILILSFALVNCQDATNSEYQVLKGATIFDGNGNSIENGIIVIKDGFIEAIGDNNLTIPSGSDIKDYTGKYITPGLVDAHIHISSSGFFDSHGPKILIDSIPISEFAPIQLYGYERYFETYLRSGITAIYNVGGQSWTLDLQHNIIESPNIPHYSSTGQIINATRTANIHDPVFVKPENEENGRQIVEYLTSLVANGIKIYELNFEDEEHLKVIRAVADEINKRNNRIIAHAVNLRGAKEIVRLGAKVLVHSVRDEPVDDEFVQLAKENDVVYVPNLCVIDGYIKGFKSLMGAPFQIDDPNDVLDSRTLDLLTRAPSLGSSLDSTLLVNQLKGYVAYQELVISNVQSNLMKLYENGVKIAVGTDAGNPGTLHGLSYITELENLERAGIPHNKIIEMATKNGAIAMNKLELFGTLENGKTADLVIMDEDPSKNISNFRTMTHVMHLGKIRSVKEKF